MDPPKVDVEHGGATAFHHEAGVLRKKKSMGEIPIESMVIMVYSGQIIRKP